MGPGASNWWQRPVKSFIFPLMDQKLPPHHSWVKTDDGSYTLFSEAFQEACHSTSGAKAETILHYVNGCKVKQKLEVFNPLVILEVGFGLGVGLLTTMEELPAMAHVHFVSLELDKNLLDWFASLHPEFQFEWHGNVMKGQKNNFKISVIHGDARIVLPAFMNTNHFKFHAIYQDAFSPKKNPILWTKEWFGFLKEHSHDEVILSTYSASSSIRKSLLEAGWKLTKGDKFGPKRTSTRAALQGESDQEILEQLSRSPVQALSDLNVSEILNTMKT